jgi:2-keto-4-pentenoate hydratase/2-oxohepta-3-ene-1,7-dioic acid hydratase in catechol pathway
VDSLDYECELGVVIGKEAKNVKREDVPDYIFGYTIVNDVSARNLQTRHKQWYFGKSLDGFTPMGPCIVSADEFAFPPKQRIACRVNGDVRQDSNTANLITGITDIIVMLSEGMTLKAGTVIATGTPAGVGMGMKPPTFLKPGDVVECEIEGIGVLRNYIEG